MTGEAIRWGRKTQPKPRRVKSTVHAARQRLRPILLTSLASIPGVMPLVLSTRAGSGGRVAIGTGLIGGMLTGPVLAIFLVPLLFVVILRLSKVKPLQPGDTDPDCVEHTMNIETSILLWPHCRAPAP